MEKKLPVRASQVAAITTATERRTRKQKKTRKRKAEK